MTNPEQDPTASRRAVLAKSALVGAVAVGAAAGTAAPASAHSDRYARGMAALRRIGGERATDVIEALRNVAPDLSRYVVEFAFGDIYVRPGLTARQRQLVTTTCLAALDAKIDHYRSVSTSGSTESATS